MRIVVLDTEHSTGAFRPYEDGFYMACCGVVTITEEGRDEELVWFDHKDVEATVDGVQRIQNSIEGADLLVFHNAKHDVSVLRGFGVVFGDTKLHCTMITDYLIEGQNKEMRWSLDAVAERYGLGQKDDKVREYWNNGVDTYDIPDYILGPYCLKDCHLTLDIYEKQLPRIDEAELWKVVNLQNEYTYVLVDMEGNGLFFNQELAHDICTEYQNKADRVLNLIMDGLDFQFREEINLNSPQQLSAFLFGGLLKTERQEWTIVEYKTKPYSKYYEKTIREQHPIAGIGFKPDKRTKNDNGYYKTDKDTIFGLSAPNKKLREIKKQLVEFAKHSQVVKTLRGKNGDKGLLSKVQPDGCLHPSLNQVVAATGRLTSSDPNGQNMPRGNTSPIKECIQPKLDGIMQVDLSQVEWRDAAWLSQDPVMMQEINSGVDQHVATVVEMMELEFVSKADTKSKENRDHAKVFNFRMIFGGTEWGFYLDINMPNFTIKKWRRIIYAFFVKYAGLKSYHQTCISFVFRNGYIKLPTGRWFKFNKKHIKGEFTYAINQIKNYPIQGMSGGDILPLMAVIIRRGMRKMGLKSNLILTVHDSIVFDYINGERDKLARLCYNVGNNLGTYIKSYYKIDWDVNLECEVEYSDSSYGEMKYLAPEEVAI